MAALKSPSRRVYTAMSRWFDIRRPLLGSDSTVLDCREDLAALVEQSQPDRLSKLLYNRLGYIFKVRKSTPLTFAD